MEKILDLLGFNTWGTLSVISNKGKPLAVPMNYVTAEEKIYFHSIPHTQIAKHLDKEVCFSCVDELSFIPGNWMTLSGNPGIGTVFYRSILLWDTPSVVNEIEEKCKILNLLCEKFEPGGKYKRMYPSNRALKNIMIWSLDINKATYRYRLGENLGRIVLQRIKNNLEKRGTILDKRTKQLMENR